MVTHSFRERSLAVVLACAGFVAWTIQSTTPALARAAAEPPPTATTDSRPEPSGPDEPDEPDEPEAAHAASRLELRDEIVVSANFALTERDDVGSSVDVITRADIERHRWPTVADALRTVPGTEIARSGGPGQLTSLFVRGGSSSQALVLVDGVRLNSATTGAVDFADLMTTEVERIEVLRGPQSTLYGSEAAAGVVSIITSRGATGASTRRASLLAEAGEDDHARVTADASFVGSRVDGGLSASWLDSDGVSAADARRGHPETDRFENRTIVGRLGAGLGLRGSGPGSLEGGGLGGDGGRIDLTLRQIEGDVEVDGFSFFDGPVDDLDATNARDARMASLQATVPIGRRASSTTRLGWVDDELSGRDPTNPFGEFTIESRRLEGDSRVDVELGDLLGDHLASLGASFERREGASVGSFDREVEIVAAFVQDRWTLGERASLSLGVRHDDHEQFGDETTWRVAGTVRVGRGRAGTQTRVRGSWGTGFKAPTFNDLFFPGFGNPDLRPETTEAWDLGVEQSLADDRLRLGLTWFDARFHDLIAFDFVTFLPQNVDEATSRGLEASALWRGARVDLRASHTWNETEDLATGAPLARRPEHRTAVDVGWRVAGPLRLAASAWASRDRIDSDGTELEDVERVDLTAQWLVGETIGRVGAAGLALEPYVRVLNVFDDEASEVGGFGSRGRTALAGISARWGGR